MALNEIKRDAFSISIACGTTVDSGELVALASGLAGVAEVDAKLAEDGTTYRTTIRTIGIFSIPVGSAATPAIGEAAVVTLPAAGTAEPVTLAATGTKIGTIVGLPTGGTHLYVALNI